jgi:hypothetical protein
VPFEWVKLRQLNFKMATPQAIMALVGTIKLRDVLLDTVQAPCDLKTFTEFARQEHSEEHITFWIRTNQLYTQYSLSKGQQYTEQECLSLVRDYFQEDTKANLNGYTRINLCHTAPTGASPSNQMRVPWPQEQREKFFGYLKEALDSTYLLIENNTWQRFLHKKSISARLHFSRELALWCYSYADKPAFCTYPSPMNMVECRILAFVEALLMMGALILDLMGVANGALGIYAFLTYGCVARSLCGPRLCPLSLLVLFGIQPLFECCENEFVPGPPHRFDQIISSFWLLGLIAARVLCPIRPISFGLAVGWAAHVFILALTGWSWVSAAFMCCIHHRVMPITSSVEQSCQTRFVTIRAISSK